MPYKDPAIRRLKGREYVKRHRLRHLERLRAQNRATYQRHGATWKKPTSQQSRIERKKYEADHPIELRAHWALNTAVKRGKIDKPKNCELCGASGRIEGHHFKGYSKEFHLVVQWLCRKCHALEKRGRPFVPRRKRMRDPALVDMARIAAQKYSINEALLCAMVEQESGWNPQAIRYEPAFYERYVVPLIVKEQLSDGEARGRSTSWGLLQCMGQVAREHGYVGPFQKMCDDPATGLDVGARVFAIKLKDAANDTFTALQHYNGGGNQLYAGQVIDRIDRYTNGGDIRSETVADA